MVHTSKAAQRTQICPVCKQSNSVMVPGALIRPAIMNLIKKKVPDFTHKDAICSKDLNRFRFQYVQSLMASEKGELTVLDRDVLKSLHEHELLTSNIEAEFEKGVSFGEGLADRMATFGGSWKFILCFGAILIIWIATNALVQLWRPFDPYPFILLNLVLSCLAALQAPVIMMSQNRQEAKDRLRSENDYRVNLKAELEIRHLNEKIDHILSRQWERLAEIQQIQLDLMAELANIRSGSDT